MMNFIQDRLIQWILQPLYRVKKMIPQTCWRFIMSLSVLAMVSLQFAKQTGHISRYLLLILPFCLCLGLMILGGLCESMKPVNFSRPLLLCWFGTGAFILLSGILVEHDCLGDALVWLIAFPVLYIVWCNNDFRQLTKSVFDGVYLSFAVCFVMCMYRYPVKQALYQGFFANLNSLSMYSITVSVVAATDILSQKKLNVRMILADVILGMSYALAYYTGSRAGQAAFLIACVVTVVLFFINARQKLWKKLVIYALPAALAFAIFMPNTARIINGGYKVFDSLHKEQTQVVAPVRPSAQKPAQENEEWKAIQELNEERRNQGTGEGFDAFSTGRLGLWKAYLKEVEILGNSSSEQVLDEYGNPIARSAHCTPIQIAYEYGALAAVFFVAFNILSGLKAVVYAWKRKCADYSVFPMMIALTYGAYYLVEKIMYPAAHLLMLLYLLSQVALLGKTKDLSETAKN